MASTLSSKLTKLLKKTEHHDKDERFMAISDIITELETDVVVDVRIQATLSQTIVKLLEDSSVDVQTVSVKCLIVLMKRLNTEHIQEIATKLASLLGDFAAASSRDVYMIGLKTIINNLQENHTEAIVQQIVTGCLKAIANGKAVFSNKLGKGGYKPKSTDASDDLVGVDMQCAALDVIRDVLRFSSQVQSSHEEILNLLLSTLIDESESIRRRSLNVLAALSPTLSDPIFDHLMKSLIEKFKDNELQLQHFTFVQALGVTSLACGERVGPYLGEIFPQLQRFCVLEKRDMFRGTNEEQEEVWQSCLSAFESIVSRCATESRPFSESILKIALDFVSYDPNYSYADEVPMDESWEEDGHATDEGNGDWGDDDADNSVQDDVEVEEDDLSWKVRRAALRCLASFIFVNSHHLYQYYPTICKLLIDRIKERDSQIVLDIFNVLGVLIQSSLITSNTSSTPDASSSTMAIAALNPTSSCAIDTALKISLLQAGVPFISARRSTFSILEAHLDPLMKASLTSYSTRSVEVQISILALWKDVLTACSQSQQESFGWLPSAIAKLLEGSSNEDVRLKTACSTLLRIAVAIFKRHSVEPYLSQLADACLRLSSESYTFIRLNGLRLINSIFVAFYSAQNPNCLDPAIVEKLFSATLQVVVQSDVDPEVKQTSLFTLATAMSLYGDHLQTHVNETMGVLIMRMHNELTCVASLRSITRVASSPINIDTSALINSSAFNDICALMRKENAVIKQEAVITLTALIRSASKSLSSLHYHTIINAVTPHILESDLHLAHLVLDLLVELVSKATNLSPDEYQLILRPSLKLFESRLLLGASMTSLIRLFSSFACLVQSDKRDLLHQVIQSLLSSVTPSMPSNNIMAIAMSIAAIAIKFDQTTMQSLLNNSLRKLNATTPAHEIHLALFLIGELGCLKDLSSYENVEAAVIPCVSISDSLQSGAAFALGNVCGGNLQLYLPRLLSQIAADEQSQLLYFYFSALKHLLIRCIQFSDFQGMLRHSVSDIISLLASKSHTDEEGVRSMIAECFGSLIVISHETTLPTLMTLKDSSSANLREVAIVALRYAFVPAISGIFQNSELPPSTAQVPTLKLDDSLRNTLSTLLPQFLSLINDADLAVRRQTCLSINTLVHSAFSLVCAYLPEILPTLYKTLPKDESLVRVIDLGPFKHKIDDGLPIRKAAYTICDTLVEHIFDGVECAENEDLLTNTSLRTHINVDVRQFIIALKPSLKDVDEIQITAYEIWGKCAQLHPEPMMAVIDSMSDELMQNIRTQLKAAKEQLETESKSATDSSANVNGLRARDVLRTAMKAIHSIHRTVLPGRCHAFEEFYARVLKTQLLVQIMSENQLA